MSKSVYATKREANQAGWFSRRNQTNEAHLYAREIWRQKQAKKRGG